MKPASLDQELESLKTILRALEPLDDTQRRFVLKTVAERMGVTGVLLGSPNSQQLPEGGPLASAAATPVGGSASLAGQSSKQFLKSKLPKTDVLKVACLAYYLTHAKSKPHFKTNDLTSLNTEAGGTPISNPSMAVGNATKQNKFLASVGKGNKQITALGEDVVEALPDEQALATVLAKHKKPRRKTSKKSAAKAKG
jgi:hypothetical protein